MAPILARYGSFFLYSYTVVMGLGIAAAITFAYFQLRSEPKRWTAWQNGALAGMVVGLWLGRLVFVLINWSYFENHPNEMIRIEQGGLSYHAVLIGGLFTFWVWQWRSGDRTGQQLEALAVPLLLLTGFGWLACYLEGCAYGQETVLGWLAGDLPDSYGVFQVRYQTQLLGMVWSVFVLGGVGLWQKRGRIAATASFWLTLGLLSAGRAVINTWRGDAMPMWHQVRLDVIVDAILAIIFMGGWLVVWLRPRISSRPVSSER